MLHIEIEARARRANGRAAHVIIIIGHPEPPYAEQSPVRRSLPARRPGAVSGGGSEEGVSRAPVCPSFRHPLLRPRRSPAADVPGKGPSPSPGLMPACMNPAPDGSRPAEERFLAQGRQDISRRREMGVSWSTASKLTYNYRPGKPRSSHRSTPSDKAEGSNHARLLCLPGRIDPKWKAKGGAPVCSCFFCSSSGSTLIPDDTRQRVDEDPFHGPAVPAGSKIRVTACSQ